MTYHEATQHLIAVYAIVLAVVVFGVARFSR